ncbi:MAG: hypothetical protein V4639_04525 [Pseudomonadota bacterium]
MAATTAQILAAFQNQTPAEALALSRFAAWCMRGTTFSEPLDLVHEALGRALDGRRNWSLSDSFAKFMITSMKSIVNGVRRREENNPATHFSLEAMLDEDPDEFLGPGALDEEHIAKERFNACRSIAQMAHDDLRGDSAAQQVLEGMLLGMTASEMRSMLELDEKTFDAARKRATRKLGRMAGSN